ncbi:MAG: ribose-phosphate diphosphokinase [Chloroflexota bacterium]
MEHGVRIYGELAVIAGSGHPELARQICAALGAPLVKTDIKVFANENIFVQLLESVRSKDVFIVQPTCSPVNHNIMELLILIDTVKRASAGRITAVVPFYAYARSDKKDQPRVPITARLIADMIAAAGADRIMTVDLHAGQIQGFFSIPCDELSAFPLLSHYFAQQAVPDLTVVAADLGFAKKARNFADALHAEVAFVEKRRRGTLVDCLSVIGEVRGRNVLIVDDEVDRGTTLANAVGLLRKEGARDIYTAFVHPSLSESAADLLAKANLLEIICTNTEPVAQATRDKLPNLTILPLGKFLAAVIQAVHNGFSVGHTLQDYIERN